MNLGYEAILDDLQPSLRDSIMLHGVSTYFGVANWAGGRRFSVFGSMTLTSCVSPGLLVRGAGVSDRRERTAIQIQGFSPGGLVHAADHANSSGLLLKPALTGFTKMYVWLCP